MPIGCSDDELLHVWHGLAREADTSLDNIPNFLCMVNDTEHITLIW